MEESRFKSGILPKLSHGEVFYNRLEGAHDARETTSGQARLIQTLQVGRADEWTGVLAARRGTPAPLYWWRKIVEQTLMGLPVVRVTAYGGIEASDFNIYPIWRWGQ